MHPLARAACSPSTHASHAALTQPGRYQLSLRRLALHDNSKSRRSPGPPFPPDHRQAGERGAKISTTGHSQAGFDSAYSQRDFFPEAEVINFNPAPKGVVPRDIGRSWVTPNDVVSLSGKLKKITNPNQYDINPNRFYPNQTVKSTAILAALRPS